MQTHRSDPIRVLPGSQVLPPHLLACQSRGSLEDCCRDVGKLKRAGDVLLSESEPVWPYSYSDCCTGSMTGLKTPSRRRLWTSSLQQFYHNKDLLKAPEHTSFHSSSTSKRISLAALLLLSTGGTKTTTNTTVFHHKPRITAAITGNVISTNELQHFYFCPFQDEGKLTRKSADLQRPAGWLLVPLHCRS